MRFPADPGAPAGRRTWLLGSLVVYLGLLWHYRPRTPFEWDEVLFLRALQRYDVGSHSPHPPGYPLYVALGRAIEFLVGDPVVALQLLSIAAAGAAVALTWLLARKLGLPRAAATAAAAIVAVTPAFAFNANVGLSDVPGTAVVLAAALLLLHSLDNPGRLAWAAAAAAAAAAVRPQLLVTLLPVGVASVVAVLRARHWRTLMTAVAAGLAVSLACWLPAILLTGPRVFFAKISETARWMAEHEADGRIGGAAFEPLLRHWLVLPFVRLPIAIGFFALLVWGIRRAWRNGRRDAVALAAGTAACYLGVALFTLHMTTSVRYILPAVPFLALLAGSVLDQGRWRRSATALLALWMLASLVVAGPALDVRARRPAPAWEALRWIASLPTSARQVVVFFDEFRPHAHYLLDGTGTTLVQAVPGSVYGPGLAAEGDVLLVTRYPVPETESLLERYWKIDAVARLGRRRYQRCTVSRVRRDESAVFSPDWGVRPDAVELRTAGAVALPPGAPPHTLRMVVDREGVRAVLDGQESAIEPGRVVDLPLLAGEDREIRVLVPPGRPALFRVLAVAPLAPDAALLAGPVAHADGIGGAAWRSELELRNVGRRPSTVLVELLREGRPNPDPETRLLTVSAGDVLRVEDPLMTLFTTDGAALLRLRPDRAGVSATVATYDLARVASSRAVTSAVTLPATRPAGTTLIVTGLDEGQGRRTNVGVVNLGTQSMRLTATALDSRGAEVGTLGLTLGAGEFRHFTRPLAAFGRPAVRDARLILRTLDEGRLLAWATLIDEETGASRSIAARPGP